MSTYNAYIEVRATDVSESHVDELMDALADYHGTVSESARGWLALRLSVPGDSLAQATRTAILVAESETGATAIAAEVLTEEEFAARQGFVPVPDLIGATQAAERLGVSRMRVNQMLDEHKLPSILIGKTHAIPLSAVKALEATTVALGVEPGPLDLTPEQMRSVFDPAYEALRDVGVFPAQAAAVARAAGEEHDAAAANAWEHVEAETLGRIADLGQKVDGQHLVAHRTRREFGAR